jgi:hypothetical protein
MTAIERLDCDFASQSGLHGPDQQCCAEHENGGDGEAERKPPVTIALFR